MPSPAERQRRRARKEARQRKRRQKRATDDGGRSTPLAQARTLGGRLQAAACWPLLEALVSRAWDDPHELTQVLLARRAPDGRVAAATFLVDLACLGVKDGFARICRDASAYRTLRGRLRDHMPMEVAEAELAATIVREGLRYARELGFEPHPDAASALPLLGDLGDSPVEVPLGGPDGRPLFIQGPNDDVQGVLDRLDRQLGPDGYHFVLQGDERGALRQALVEGEGSGVAGPLDVAAIKRRAREDAGLASS